jgi:hypothetical protein
LNKFQLVSVSFRLVVLGVEIFSFVRQLQLAFFQRGLDAVCAIKPWFVGS